MEGKRDEYVCVPSEQLASLRGQVYGWGDSDSLAQDLRASSEAPSVLESMLNAGLLTSEAEDGKQFQPSAAMPAVEAVTKDQAPRKLPVTSVLRLLTACIRASLELRFRTIQHVVQSVQARHRRRTADDSLADAQVYLEHVRRFHALRPIYPRKYNCLFDSLALLHYLASYGQFPTWIFGIQMSPFYAHCWVQWKDVALNETQDGVRWYSPIMTI